MVRLISIDVGIKNLAYCLFTLDENEIITIEKWGVVDLSQQKEMNEEKIQCSCIIKSSKIKKQCSSDAKWKKGDSYYCMKHAKTTEPYILPTPQLKNTYLKKQNMMTIKETIEKLGIVLTRENMKKEELLDMLNTYLENHLYEPVNTSCKVNASLLDLVSIGKNMKYKFDELFGSIQIDKVIIENQISPIASRMKTIQGMISQYFIMTSSPNNKLMIDFVNSSNKLKVATLSTTIELKNKYKDRKSQGIQQVRSLLADDSKWITFFENYKKKDDLADCYLQGIWYMKMKK